MRRTKRGSLATGLLALALSCLALAAACASQPKATPADTARPAAATASLPVPPPAKADWKIALSGARTETLSSSYYGEAKAHGTHYVERLLEKKGAKVAYKGMLLRQLLAMVDGPDAKHPFRFDEALWLAGYEVTVTARDGYSASFSTKDYPVDAFLLADSADGVPIPPSIVGEAPKGLWVQDVVEIAIKLPSVAESRTAPAAEAAFSLDLDINGTKASFTFAQLESSPFYLEGRGGYTTSAGTRYEGVYGGVRLRALIEQYAIIGPGDTVGFVAMDGYEMSYPGATVLDESDGVWILAFKLDGEYLPKDPGYVRTIKVGPGAPNIDGHLSVRMVKSVTMSQKGWKDFSLVFEGRMALTIDRTTMQSGVSCHKRSVNFERKDVKAVYTGIALWRLLAYTDDPRFAPHRQDSSILSYDKTAAAAGYKVEIIAEDGYSIVLDSRELDGNDDVIVAMYKDGAELPEGEFPLILVWDKDAKVVPAGIKPVKRIVKIRLVFP